MKRRIFVMACAFALLIVGSAFATPAPNSAVIIPRVFDDCPLSVLTTTNNYPSLINIDDDKGAVPCGGFANLHIWRFSADGVNPAVFNNGDAFSISADLVLTGMGEAGLQVAPWWSQNVDGRFNVRSTDGEIACFGGRLPFYSFTANHGLHYVAGDAIHLEIVYDPNDLTMVDPATIEYKIVYQGMNYTSGVLPFDQANPGEDPPHGLWGILNDAHVGGYLQVLMQAGTGAEATFTNLELVSPPLSAVIIPRVFDDCPLSVLSITNIFPSRITIDDDKGAVPCGGFANLHVWRFSEDGVNQMVFDNGDAFTISTDLVLSGMGEAGLQVSPWWSQEVDGRFNVRSTDGEIACFGGRLPFYSFTANHGLHYAAGDLIHLEIVYDPNSLTQADPGTIEYKLSYQGMDYTSGVLPFDQGNPAEDPPHGLWGILNDARVGGYSQVLMQAGNGSDATFTNIALVVPMTVAVDVKPGSCENTIGVNSKGVLPVAILGSADLDVSLIDVSSVRLEGVPAKMGTIEDVEDATTSACEECVPLDADEYPDLLLKFSVPSILMAIAPVPSEDVELHLTGMLMDGTPFQGVDCVGPRGNVHDERINDISGTMKIVPLSAPNAPVQKLGYSIPSEMQVRISVYTVSGRLVQVLVQGIEGPGNHTVSWDASREPSGVYFYRFQAQDFDQTVKGLIVR